MSAQKPINTKNQIMLTLTESQVKTLIETELTQRGVEFQTAVDWNIDQTYQVYYYTTDNGLFGFWTLENGNKFAGFVQNNGLVNWALSEGFQEMEINRDFKIWIPLDTPEKFLELLTPWEEKKLED